jgi:superfamily II DNA or RNA helicase
MAGKTIQIISLIGQLRAAGTPGPFLVAGPLAVLPNWINEFKKWLPSCPVVLYHGTREERENIRQTQMQPSTSKLMSFPVVVTSFEICMIDRPHLERYLWQYIILDEGHRIKNRNCRLVRELKQLPSTSRLLLTGTPIQVNTCHCLFHPANNPSIQHFFHLTSFILYLILTLFRPYAQLNLTPLRYIYCVEYSGGTVVTAELRQPNDLRQPGGLSVLVRVQKHRQRHQG